MRDANRKSKGQTRAHVEVSRSVAVHNNDHDDENDDDKDDDINNDTSLSAAPPPVPHTWFSTNGLSSCLFSRMVSSGILDFCFYSAFL